MKSLLDPTFQYVPSVKTDIRKTFARVRREQKAEADRQAALKAEAAGKVSTLRKVSV